MYSFDLWQLPPKSLRTMMVIAQRWKVCGMKRNAASLPYGGIITVGVCSERRECLSQERRRPVISIEKSTL